MFRHIAMFRFKDDVPEPTIAEFRSRLLSLADAIESIRRYEVGSDLGLAPTTWDMVVIADFDDVDGYRAYVDHPDHIPVVDDLRAHIADRAAVQSEAWS